jgi:Na+/H+-dicarboxylate symporter
MGSLTFIARLNPINFLKGITHALIFAFSSTSGAATLPVTIRCAEENLGVSPGIARFLLPIGTSLNMNGLSIYLGAAAVFAANVYGVHLDFMQYLTVVLTIVLTCMGAGGVPGSAIIVMSAVLSSVGLPIGVVALIAGIDRILDMGSTTTNVMGDVYTAVMIAKSEGELDHSIYNAQDDAQANFTAGSALERSA